LALDSIHAARTAAHRCAPLRSAAGSVNAALGLGLTHVPLADNDIAWHSMHSMERSVVYLLFRGHEVFFS